MEPYKLFDLSGRVALITGASTKGIGSASAKLLAACGAKVFLVARRAENLQAMADEICQTGGEAGWYAGDVSDERACQAAVSACLERFGHLDIMLLSAGISGKSEHSMEDLFDTEAYRKVMSINLDGTFFMLKYGWEACSQNGVGSIILVDSLAGFKAAGHVPYTASKGAIRAWTKLFGKKLAPHHVRVNAIVPGLTDSEMVHPKGNDEMFQKHIAPSASRIPLGRLGTPEDMAAGVLYLASDAAAWVTGHCLVIDGGELC